MPPPDTPTAPTPREPPDTWEHRALYERVREALAALPGHFRSETFISGILATDLQTLNSVLGASIEEQTVSSLNAIRTIWDPTGDYALYRFVRQPQAFPDVLLRKAGGGRESIVMGIELKGWYVLAKEGVPTFRYEATPAACADADLLVVVPWALSQVISGRPIVLTPYIVEARFAAEYRNHHWQNIRDAQSDPQIVSPVGATPYPQRGARSDDRPVSDASGNFGRFARTGVMEDFMNETRSQLLCGVRVDKWLSFFQSLSADDADPGFPLGPRPRGGRRRTR
jgi:hypothetical protein